MTLLSYLDVAGSTCFHLPPVYTIKQLKPQKHKRIYWNRRDVTLHLYLAKIMYIKLQYTYIFY